MLLLPMFLNCSLSRAVDPFFKTVSLTCALNNRTLATIIHGADHSDKLRRYPITLHDLPQGFPVNTVKSLFIVDKTYIQAGVPFHCLLYDVPENEYLLYRTSSVLKPACSFLNFASTPPDILLINTLPITFAATDIKVIPHQFPHLVRSFFCQS